MGKTWCICEKVAHNSKGKDIFIGILLLLLITTQSSSAKLYRLCHLVLCVCMCAYAFLKRQGTESEENRKVKPCQIQGEEGWFPLLHPTQLGTRSNAPIRVSKCQRELKSAQASLSARIRSKPPSKKSWGAPFVARIGISTTFCSKPGAGSDQHRWWLPQTSQPSKSVPCCWGVPVYFIPPAFQESCLQHH